MHAIQTQTGIVHGGETIGKWEMATGGTSPSTSDTVTTGRKLNRLAHEKSPYLLQHADNPIDWLVGSYIYGWVVYPGHALLGFHDWASLLVLILYYVPINVPPVRD